MIDRRTAMIRGLLAAAAAGSAGSPIARALALPSQGRTGTIADVEHVVILMQENRSFDHYFGAMRGVRGFDDPAAITVPGGAPVWHQPVTRGAGPTIAPFRLNADGHNHNAMASLDHHWRGDWRTWQHYDAWPERKSALTMGYHDRRDLPFYYALADAFTVCDAYHCSIFGPTNPNRMFLFAGTSGPGAGFAGPQVTTNVDDGNWTGDATRDRMDFAAYRWTTYAERLQQAGIDWRVYQEHDNFGDNSLAYFAAFRGLAPTDPLRRRGRDTVPGSTAANAQESDGEHLVAALRRDVLAGTLPQVSWVVAPFKLCEHPEARGMEFGEYLVAQILDALTADPEVWGRTALFITYDENDGFFDHMPPPMPAAAGAPGQSTVPLTGEEWEGQPLGMGPRVPMLVVSPWSKGGWVNSQVFDHTSVIRFLEQRFGVAEPNITAWRRTVAGDLTSAFDFAGTADATMPRWPATAGTSALVEQGRQARRPAPPAQQAVPRQEPGRRPARALPYRLESAMAVDPASGALTLTLRNAGTAGAFLHLRGEALDAPHFYTLDASGTLAESLPQPGDWLRLHGPNGMLHEASPAALHRTGLAIDGCAAGATFRLSIANHGTAPQTIELVTGEARRLTLAPGGIETVTLDLAPAGGWFDVSVRLSGEDRRLMRFAGRAEDGSHGQSDPAIGAACSAGWPRLCANPIAAKWLLAEA